MNEHPLESHLFKLVDDYINCFHSTRTIRRADNVVHEEKQTRSDGIYFHQIDRTKHYPFVTRHSLFVLVMIGFFSFILSVCLVSVQIVLSLSNDRTEETSYAVLHLIHMWMSTSIEDQFIIFEHFRLCS